MQFKAHYQVGARRCGNNPHLLFFFEGFQSNININDHLDILMIILILKIISRSQNYEITEYSMLLDNHLSLSGTKRPWGLVFEWGIANSIFEF